jgi:hypothetical protein
MLVLRGSVYVIVRSLVIIRIMVTIVWSGSTVLLDFEFFPFLVVDSIIAVCVHAAQISTCFFILS